jgi:hypothetical protein
VRRSALPPKIDIGIGMSAFPLTTTALPPTPDAQRKGRDGPSLTQLRHINASELYRRSRELDRLELRVLPFHDVATIVLFECCIPLDC